MNARTEPNFVHVTLSERNLNDLVAAFQRQPNAATLRRMCENGMMLLVTIEADDKHYKDGRKPGPGING